MDSPSPEPPGADRSRLSLVCRFVLAAVFLMAAVTKITDLRGFEAQVLPRSPLPEWLGLAAVRILPWLELTCGACLLAGYAVREAALFCALMLVLFIVHALAVPADADCGCFLFPPLTQSGRGWWLPVRNSVFLLCAVRVALKR